MNQVGFTLIEITLVISLMFVLGVFVSPIGMSFYHSQLINETSDGLISALRQAQSFAMTGKHGASHGVSIRSDTYVVFAGESYNIRLTGEDIVFPLGSSVAIDGPTEITFSHLTGEPSVTGTYQITLGNKERIINVLPSGNIDQ